MKALIDEHGTCSWTKVGESFSERTGKQCRERWYNHLDPSVKKGEWTAEVRKNAHFQTKNLQSNEHAYPPSGGHDSLHHAEDNRKSMGQGEPLYPLRYQKTIFTDTYSTQRTRRSQRHFLAARTTPSRTDSMRLAAHNLGKILETTKNPLIITTVTRIATQTQRKNLKSHLEGIRTWSLTVPRSR